MRRIVLLLAVVALTGCSAAATEQPTVGRVATAVPTAVPTAPRVTSTPAVLASYAPQATGAAGAAGDGDTLYQDATRVLGRSRG